MANKKSSKLTRADKAIRWIEEYCRVPEGKLIGQKVQLRDWQKAELRKIYDNPVGTRLAIISFGRKNGKTALAAFLLLLHLCGPEHKLNSQLFSAAQSRDQAALIFALAAKVVRMSPDLRGVVVVRDAAKELVCADLGTKFKSLSAEASTAFGLSPAFIVHDELGQVRGERSALYEALETATGAQEAPLSIIISTQAPTDNDLLSRLIDDAVAGHDPSTVVSLYTAPMEADPFEIDTIKMANPAFGDFLNEKEVLKMAEKARRMASEEAGFRNLVLNQRVEASSPFVSRSVWMTCGDDPKPITGIPVYCGLDLSEVADLTAFVMIGLLDDVWQVHCRFWLPEDGLHEKSQKDRVPYDRWAKEGFITAVPGKSIDYEYVAEELREIVKAHNIEKIAFDRWNFSHFKRALERAGFQEDEIEKYFVEFGQGFQSMSPALRSLEGEILNKRLAHGNNPVMSMCAANAVTESNPAGGKKLTKSKSNGRIDGMVALTMAFGVAPLNDPEPEYQMIII